MMPAALILNHEKPETFWRTLQTFNVTRIVVAMVLLAYLSVHGKTGNWVLEFFSYPKAGIIYLLCAIGFVILAAYHRRHYMTQILVPIVVDIAAISILYIGAGGTKGGLGILFLFPLAGSAVLAPLVIALLFVSVTTLILLGESGYQILQSSPDASTLQAGLYAGAFFFAVFVINRLAGKLIKQEELADQRGKDLRTQMAINRIAIADMGDGLLVVSKDGTLMMANPAAERMLGLSFTGDEPRYRLIDFSVLEPIADAFFEWAAGDRVKLQSHSEQTPNDRAVFVTVKHTDESSPEGIAVEWGTRRELTARLKLRFVSVQTYEGSEYRTVIFLQDVSEIENQAQQLKLASMGRLTASIAHEVRNPLSSISYAATLLAEEAVSPVEIRLLSIIDDNVARLNRMIEDILKLSRKKVQQQSEPILLVPLLSDIVAEFQVINTIGADMIEMLITPEDQYRVWFDPLHLREVVTNLLSNAVRYASACPGSIRLHVMSGAANRLELHVQDDGEPITQTVRSHLFEPFYTTSSRGTGLGLFLARELCLNNGSLLDYEYRRDNHGQVSGRFVIVFAVQDSQ